MPLLEQPLFEVIAQHDRHASRPLLVDRDTIGFVVARVAEDIGDAEPVADAALGGE